MHGPSALSQDNFTPGLSLLLYVRVVMVETRKPVGLFNGGSPFNPHPRTITVTPSPTCPLWVVTPPTSHCHYLLLSFPQ